MNESKWINRELFEQFQQEKKEEKERPQSEFLRRANIVWKNPERCKSHQDNPNVYEGRFLPDPNGKFYVKFFYHLFRFGENWYYYLCLKTHSMTDFCPWCVVSSKLWKGSDADKALASNLTKKVRFVGNWFVISDFRDNNVEEEEAKSKGKVKLYEFPGKVESKLKEEVTDERGYGPAIFDPSEYGYNFILKVGATKPDREGKVWPDYSNSSFDRRPSSLGTDEEVEAMMQSTYSLAEYIRSLERPLGDSVDILKQNMLYDYTKEELEKHINDMKAVTDPDEGTPEPGATDDIPFDIDSSETTISATTNESTPSEEYSDEDLLKELEDL